MDFNGCNGIKISAQFLKNFWAFWPEKWAENRHFSKKNFTGQKFLGKKKFLGRPLALINQRSWGFSAQIFHFSIIRSKVTKCNILEKNKKWQNFWANWAKRYF